MNEYTTITTTAAEIYTTADRATATMLKGRIAKTAQAIDFDLLRAARADAITRRGADLAAEIETLTAERDTATKTAAKAARRMMSTKATAEERDTQAAIYDRQSARAAALNRRVQSLTERLSQPFTDRADLVQEAAIAYWLTATKQTAPKFREWEQEALEEARATEGRAAASAAAFVEEWANRRAAINAAGREHDKNRKANAYEGNKTKRREATAAEVENWLATMGGTGASVKRAAQMKRTRESECWQTMEWREPTATHGGAWVLVTHYKTVRRGASVDEMRESGAEPTDTTGERAEEQTTAADLVRAVLECVKLTERERAYITARTSEAAKAAGEAAKAAYFAKRDGVRAEAAESVKAAQTEAERERAAQECRRLNSNSEHLREQLTADREAARAEHAHAIAAAFGGESVKADTADKFRRRLFDKVRAAIIEPKHHTEPQSVEEWARFMGNTRRGGASTESRRRDLVAWTAGAGAHTAAVIDWQTAEAAQDAQSRAAESRRAAAERSTIDNTTTEAATLAAVAADRYTIKAAGARNADQLTAEDTTKAAAKLTKHRAKRRAEQERRAAKQAAGIAAGLPREVFQLSSTFEAWQKWSAEARAAHMEYIKSI